MQKNNKIYVLINLSFFIFFIFIFYNHKIINKNFFIFNLKDIYALCKCNLINNKIKQILLIDTIYKLNCANYLFIIFLI